MQLLLRDEAADAKFALKWGCCWHSRNSCCQLNNVLKCALALDRHADAKHPALCVSMQRWWRLRLRCFSGGGAKDLAGRSPSPLLPLAMCS
jgi:hypothetical protein